MRPRFLATRLAPAGLLSLVLAASGCTTAHLAIAPPVQTYPAASVADPDAVDSGHDVLRVMSLNIAHGRGESFHQLLQSSSSTVSNLGEIATVLKDSGAHVVALQEADGPSFWSGNFNHIAFLANHGAFSHSLHGFHAEGLGLAYGTALIANASLNDSRAITFDPELSFVPKGFVISAIDWPGATDIEIDIVSVHLDFASHPVRLQQAKELVATVRERNRPAIIMGDLNAGWHGDSVVQFLCRELGLSAYRPQAPGLETFPALGERLDWILVPEGIAFHSYRVLTRPVSDHRAIVAELQLKPTVIAGGF